MYLAGAQDRLFTQVGAVSVASSGSRPEPPVHGRSGEQKCGHSSEKVADVLGIEQTIDDAELVYHDQDRASVAGNTDHGWRARSQRAARRDAPRGSLG